MGIMWDYDQTTMCFMGQTCRSTSLSLSYFGKKMSSQISQEILLITDAPHLTIQTSFSSSYSQHTPSLMTGATLTQLTPFLHPAIPPTGTFPFGDAGTNWWKFSATKSAPSASWIQGIKSSSRMRRPEANTSHPSNPGQLTLGFFNKNLSCFKFQC